MKHLSILLVLLVTLLGSCTSKHKSPANQVQELGFSCSDHKLTQIIQGAISDLRPECTTSLSPSLMSVHMAADYAYPDTARLFQAASSLLMDSVPQSLTEPLYALFGLRQYYLHYGSLTRCSELKERIINQLTYYTSIQKPEGYIQAEDGSTPTYLQILLCENYRIAAEFAYLWGDEKLSQYYTLKASYVEEAITKGFWDDDHHAFLSGIDAQGKRDSSLTTLNQIWAVYTGLFPQLYLEKLLINHEPPLECTLPVPPALEAMAYVRAGFTHKYLDLLKEYDPTGIDLSASIIPVVLHGVFGLSPTMSSEGEYILTPDLGSLEWIKGCIPVKEGPICFEFTSKGKYHIDLPPHTKLILNWRGKTKKID